MSKKCLKSQKSSFSKNTTLVTKRTLSRCTGFTPNVLATTTITTFAALYQTIMKNAKGFSTVSIHAGYKKNQYRSHLTPIYSSSTYLFDSAEQAADLFMGREKGYAYGRFGNPTITEVEEKIAALEAFNLKNEDGTPLELKSIFHASGMAGISTLFLSTLKHGDAILTHYSLYGGTQELLDKVLADLDIKSHIIDCRDLALVEKTIKENPSIKMLYIETPANPTLKCYDIEALTKVTHLHGLKVAVDNTFATPYLQQPFAFGVDFVFHSTTKFLNGHGTAIGGILIGKDIQFMSTKATKHHRLLGANSNGFDSFLLINGVKTLGLRMDQHCKNADAVVKYLSSHPKVDFVNHLGLPSHPDYALAKKQMKHGGALLSFELKGGYEAGKKFLNSLELLVHAVSLGTVDTLISHPASTTHAGVPRDLRIASGITDGLIRLSVGLENVEDIIADIDQALAKI